MMGAVSRIFSIAVLAAALATSAVAQNVSFISNGGLGTTTYVSSANPLPVTNSGGEGGAVFGPTAVGSPAANPPVVTGGTATGGATGNVQAIKVDASGNQFFHAATATPSAGAATAIGTGGTAVTAVTGPVNGCTIANGLTATDEGVTIEPIYVNPVTTATVQGNTTTYAIQPGQSFNCIPGQTTNVSINAATTGHKFTVVAW